MLRSCNKCIQCTSTACSGSVSKVKRIDFLKDTRELLRWRRAAEDGLQGRAAFRTGTGRVLKDEELHQVAGSMAERMRRRRPHGYPWIPMATIPCHRCHRKSYRK